MNFDIIDVFQLTAVVILFAAGPVRRQKSYQLFEKTELNIIVIKNCYHAPHVHYSIIYNSQDMETT